MTEISLLAEEGSVLYQAAALRGASDNPIYGASGRLVLAQQAADNYSRALNEVYYVLAVALGKVGNGQDWEGNPSELVWEAAHILKDIRI